MVTGVAHRHPVGPVTGDRRCWTLMHMPASLPAEPPQQHRDPSSALGDAGGADGSGSPVPAVQTTALAPAGRDATSGATGTGDGSGGSGGTADPSTHSADRPGLPAAAAARPAHPFAPSNGSVSGDIDAVQQPGDPVRDGVRLPGRTVPAVVTQLAFRVLGPYRNRAASVLYWAGLRGHPPGPIGGVAARYGVTPQLIGHRLQVVAAAGARVPLDAGLVRELTRATRPGEDREVRRRCALLLGHRVLTH